MIAKNLDQEPHQGNHNAAEKREYGQHETRIYRDAVDRWERCWDEGATLGPLEFLELLSDAGEVWYLRGRSFWRWVSHLRTAGGKGQESRQPKP